MAVFLSVSFPSFSLWNLSITPLSIILFPLSLHSSHSLSCRQQPSRLSRQWVMVLFCFFFFGGGVFLDGWGLTGSDGSFRSSHLRSPSCMPEERGWRKPIEQIFDPATNAHTCTHTLTHSRRFVLTAHCLLPSDLQPGSAFATTDCVSVPAYDKVLITAKEIRTCK